MLLFSCSVESNSLRPRGLQHIRLPYPSPPPGACSNSCPFSQWRHPTISSCPQSFPASGSFPKSPLFTAGGQSIWASVSASILLMNIQDWFLLGLTGLISLQSKGLSRVLQNHSLKASILLHSIFPSFRVFSNESGLHIRWPNYWSFSISPFSEYSGLISFRMDWLDLLEVQGTLKSSPKPQFKSINSLALSFLYSPTLTSIHDYWKNHSLD